MVTPAPYRPMRRIQAMAVMAVMVACLSISATAVITPNSNGSTNDVPTPTTPTPTTTAPTPTTTAPTPTTTAPTPTTTAPTPTTTAPTPTTTAPTPTTAAPTPTTTTTTPETTSPPASTTSTPATTTPAPSTGTTSPPTSTTKTPKPTSARGSGSNSVDGLNEAGNNGINAATPAPASKKSYGVIIAIAVVAVVVLVALGFVVYRHRSKKDDEDKELRRQLDLMDVELGSAAYAIAGTGAGTGSSEGSAPRGSSGQRRSSLQQKNAAKSPSSWASNRTTLRGSESDSLSPIWRNQELLAARIPYEKIRFREVMSRGGFGEVLEGVYHQQRVAVKRLLPEHRRRMASLEDFLKEALLLSTLDHPRIITFIGVAWDSPRDLCLVLEFMENGDLRNILTQWREEGRKTGWNDPRKVRIALHVAEALTYLHTLTPKVVHRDLKSKNILVNGHWDAKLSDFGVSREESSHNTMTTNVGSSLWIAPEVMVGNNYDEKADIFSFGVVLSELDSMQLPYHSVRTPDGRKLPDAAVLHMVTMGKVQAEFSSMSRTDMVLLGRACLAVDPAQRPSAGEVRYRLTQILSSY